MYAIRSYYDIHMHNGHNWKPGGVRMDCLYSVSVRCSQHLKNRQEEFWWSLVGTKRPLFRKTSWWNSTDGTDIRKPTGSFAAIFT